MQSFPSKAKISDQVAEGTVASTGGGDVIVLQLADAQARFRLQHMETPTFPLQYVPGAASLGLSHSERPSHANGRETLRPKFLQDRVRGFEIQKPRACPRTSMSLYPQELDTSSWAT